MVWRGGLHHHIMTSGGTMATPARTIQLESGFKFTAMPMRDIVKTQSVATMALRDMSCMLAV